MRIGLDVDGVLADFYLGMCKKYNKPYKMIERYSVEWVLEAFKDIEDDEDFWFNLPMLSPPEAITSNIECYITHIPPKMLQARIDWLKKHNYPQKPVFVSGEKAQYCIDKDIQVLIDDKPSTIAECYRAGIVGIRFIPPYFREPINSIHHIRHLDDVKRIIEIEKSKRNIKFLAE